MIGVGSGHYVPVNTLNLNGNKSTFKPSYLDGRFQTTNLRHPNPAKRGMEDALRGPKALDTAPHTPRSGERLAREILDSAGDIPVRWQPLTLLLARAFLHDSFTATPCQTQVEMNDSRRAKCSRDFDRELAVMQVSNRTRTIQTWNKCAALASYFPKMKTSFELARLCVALSTFLLMTAGTASWRDLHQHDFKLLLFTHQPHHWRR
jgi:hypothetical protein